MYRPKIVIFWGKPKGPLEGDCPLPYGRIGVKKPVYDQLFAALAKSADVYAAIGYENYPEPMVFNNAFRYLGPDNFAKVKDLVRADVVFDRSAKMTYPGNTKLENQRVLNSSDFKLFCNNKWSLYQLFPEYCPDTRYAETAKDYGSMLDKLDEGKTYVVKPFNGLKGKGIEFGKPAELRDYQLEVPVIVQDFKETSGGMPGLATGRHDLRVAVVDGQIVWVTIRQPQGEGLLANVHQGGSITEIKISEIPASVLPIVKHLSREFKKNYYNPLFSIDFGFENGEPFIYEINDQIGFPLPEMKNNRLIESLAVLLIKKTNL